MKLKTDKRERDLIQQYLSGIVTQAQAKKRLKLKDATSFYRIFHHALVDAKRLSYDE